MRRDVLVGTLLVLATGGANAEPIDPKLDSTRALLELCSAEPGTPRFGQRRSYCEGFIAGTGLLYQVLVEAGSIKPWACADETPSAEAVRAAFVTWANANPSRLGDPPVDGFWRAMAATWPCPETAGAPVKTKPAAKKS